VSLKDVYSTMTLFAPAENWDEIMGMKFETTGTTQYSSAHPLNQPPSLKNPHHIIPSDTPHCTSSLYYSTQRPKSRAKLPQKINKKRKTLKK